MDEIEIEEDDFATVAEENNNFLNSLFEHNSLMSFLNRDKVIYARSACVEEADRDVFFKYETDVDGCVVELNSFIGIKMPVRHLTVFHRDHVRMIRTFLKKHVNLTKYTRDVLPCFSHSVGFQLFYEYGWEGWIGIIPSPSKCKHKVNAKIVSEIGSTYFKTVRVYFQKKLFAQKSTLMRTLAKNDMNDVRNFSVLPDDKDRIFAILQEAIDETKLPEEFERVLFCFRFGEKSRNGINLNVFNLSEVKEVTVHSAVDIYSDTFELMWSMSGLQGIVGNRGTLSTCLSFRDCGNFQSNLDGKMMDICKDLKEVCHNTSGDIRFMQLYVDVPHRKPNSRFHPVSGCIAGGLVFHKETYSAFKGDAGRYISTLQSNFCLLEKSSCRLEVVHTVKEVKDVIHATDFINMQNVFSLLKKYPLIVPFEMGMVRAVHYVGRYIVTKLKSLLDNYSGTGNIEAMWRAYQLELAAEKMLWGTPFSSVSHLLSVNLGPGRLEESRSLTDQKGFLALERWTACMATEYSIPPCCLWSQSALMQRMIRRSAGLHDVLGSCPFVVGRRLVHSLIMDMYEDAKLPCRIEEFKQELFIEQPTMFHVSGGVTLKRLSDVLSANRRVGTHMVFGCQCKLIRNSKSDLAEVIVEGLKDLRLKHFPALKLYDVHCNAILSWDKRYGLWKIFYNEETSGELVQCPITLTKLIVTELEMRRLVYASKLKSAPSRFPWIASCVRKLSHEKLNNDQLVCVLSFVSCIALMMNGWFVDYNQLVALCNDLPMKQHRLKDLEIQSKLLLSKFNTIQLYRLHHSIPSRIVTKGSENNASTSKEQQPRKEETVSETVQVESVNTLRISDDAEEEKNQRIQPRLPTCLPLTKSKLKWNSEEIEILYKVTGKKRKHDEVYELYKAECLKENIPFHGNEAFRRKLQRVQKDMDNDKS